MDLPKGPFSCILADPPWAFRTYSNKSGTTPHRGAEDHYPVACLEDMAAIPVAEIAAKDCALFMWVVDSHMDEAFELARAWGFTFKTCAFVWFKGRNEGVVPKVGMGYWTRKQTEQCWLFTKGKPQRVGKGVEQAIFCGRGRHSAKPDEQYDRIEALVSGPYLEFFRACLERDGQHGETRPALATACLMGMPHDRIDRKKGQAVVCLRDAWPGGHANPPE